MKRKILFIVIPIFLASYKDKLQYYDISTYSVMAKGLRDLSYKVKSKEIVDEINTSHNFGKIEEVIFQVYWIDSGKIDLDIMGIPRGFIQLKSKLMADFIDPLIYFHRKKAFELSKHVNFEEKKVGSEIILKGSKDFDPTLKIDSNGRIKYLTQITPRGVIEQYFEEEKKGIYDNKWILVKQKNILTIREKEKITKEMVVSYEKVEGLYLPSEILYSVTYKDKTKSYTLKFYDYKINSGIAKEFFRKKR